MQNKKDIFKVDREIVRSAFSVSGKLPLRIRKRPAFLKIAATGNKVVTPSFIIQIGNLREGSDSNRLSYFGFTASKKVGNAVERSRAKRKLKELVRVFFCRTLAPEHDYVLVARKTILKRPMAQMLDDAKKAISRINRG